MEARIRSGNEDGSPPSAGGLAGRVHLAVALLLLAVGASSGLRPSLGASGAPSGAAAQVETERPAPPPLPSPAAAEASAGSMALGWEELLAQELNGLPLSGPARELVASRQRELAQRLSRRLEQDPNRWSDVLEVLAEEDPRIGRKITEVLGEGISGSAEPILLKVLQNGRHREMRMSAASLIGAGGSLEGRQALRTAAAQDPDAGVRHQALSQLLRRTPAAAPASETQELLEFLSVRAQVDPDPEVRLFALRASGQGVPEGIAPPPPPAPVARSTGIRFH